MLGEINTFKLQSEIREFDTHQGQLSDTCYNLWKSTEWKLPNMVKLLTFNSDRAY